MDDQGFVTGMIRRLVLLMVWATLVATSARAGPAETLQIRIDGHPYQAQLEGNLQLADALGAHQALVRGKHYRGRLRSVSGSWLRLSRVEQQWSGVVSLFDRLHLVSGSAADGQLKARPVAKALNALEETPTCATPPEPSPLVAHSDDEQSSTLTMPSADTATRSGLCSNTVEGVCLLPELEMVFDSGFASTFSANTQDKALSLVNIVDGFYRQDLDLAFETLTMKFPNSELFNSSSDAHEFLGDPQDSTTMEGITDKKPDLDFIANQNALLHVVTGRDFNGSTVGVAWSDVLCEGSGYSSGTSQVLNNDIAVTAVVVAHEIGHNFGAVHDGDSNSCASSGYIMSASVNTSDPPNRFSSCSVTEMHDSVDTLASGSSPYSLEQCFQHPVDAGIAADPGNPTEVNASTSATLDLFYDVSYEQARAAADGIRVTGSVNSADGELREVALAGISCSMGSNDLTYNCTGTPASQQLRVRVHSSNDQLRLEHAVVIEGGDYKDMVAGNDQINTNLPVTLPSEQPTDLSASAHAERIELSWTDQARGEDGYEMQRKGSGTSSWTVVSNEAADTESWVDDSVDRYQSYDYRVAATGSVDGTASNVVSAIAGTPPLAPSGLSLTEQSDQVQLSWQDNATTEDAYRIERQKPGDTSWTVLARPGADSEQYLDSTVVRGQTYRYRVQARNAVGLSPASNVVEGAIAEPDTGGDDDGGDGSGGSSGGGALTLIVGWALLNTRRRR